jgi:transcriptional regulator with XRE-family HTH domain
MTSAPVRAASPWSKALVKMLSNKAFRDVYVEDHIRTGIAFQIRALREQRGWSQGELADITKTSQSAISRVEDPDYGKLSLKTLLAISSAMDAPLLVQFVEWEDWLARYSDVSPSALKKRSFDCGRLLALSGNYRSEMHTAQEINESFRASVPCAPKRLANQSIGRPPSSAVLNGRQEVSGGALLAPPHPGSAELQQTNFPGALL